MPWPSDPAFVVYNKSEGLYIMNKITGIIDETLILMHI